MGCAVCASECFDFAMKHRVPPQFPQSRFALVLSSKGEARVLTLAFATPKAEANVRSTPFMLKLLTADLNSTAVVSGQGVPLEYNVVRTKYTDVDAFFKERQTQSVS